MTDPQPARVTPAEITDLLDHARRLHGGACLAEQITYHDPQDRPAGAGRRRPGHREAAPGRRRGLAYLAALRRTPRTSRQGRRRAVMRASGSPASRSPRSPTLTRSPRRSGGPRSTAPRLLVIALVAARPAGRGGCSGSSAGTRSPTCAALVSGAVAWTCGWPGPVVLAASCAMAAGCGGALWPASFSRLVAAPGLWPVAALALPAALGCGDDHRPPRPGLPGPPAAAGARQGGLHPLHRPGAGPPGLRPVRRPTIASRADNLAHGFGALTCRVRSGQAGLPRAWSSSAATP